ncbi:MAG: hypothetical protein Q9167_007460 [Letrouitia subvulpina]
MARIVRYAITNGLFDEPITGRIAHMPATAALAKNKGLHDMAVFNIGFSARIIDQSTDALIAQRNGPNGATAPTATAFNICHPGYANLFDYMGKYVEYSQAYFMFLDGRSQLSRYSAENIVKAWNWTRVEDLIPPHIAALHVAHFASENFSNNARGGSHCTKLKIEQSELKMNTSTMLEIRNHFLQIAEGPRIIKTRRATDILDVARAMTANGWAAQFSFKMN